MKRKVWILLALAALVSLLWSGAALAENYAFTAQPTGGTIQPDQGRLISWKTNFTPVRVEIGYSEYVEATAGLWGHSAYWNYVTVYDITSGLQPSMSKTIGYGKAVSSDKWTVRAYYNDTQFKESDEFSIDVISRQFLSSPAGGTIIPDRTLNLSWSTNFTPVRVEIGYLNTYTYQEWFVNKTVTDFHCAKTVTSGLKKSMTVPLGYSEASTSSRWIIRAYYNDSDFVDSSDFSIEVTGREFTVQPTGGNAPVQGSWSVQWNLNFNPVRQQLVRKWTTSVTGWFNQTTYYDHEEVVEQFGGSVRQRGCSENEGLVIRAFYNDTDYIDSTQFDVTETEGAFDTEPLGGLVQANNALTVGWTTNFTPNKVEFIRLSSNNAETVVDTRTGSAAAVKSSSYPFQPRNGDQVNSKYKIRATYLNGSGREKTVTSNSFFVGERGADYRFTTQPTDCYSTGSMWSSVSWDVNFLPEKTEYLTGTGTDISQYTVQPYIFCSSGVKNYVIRCYYNVAENLYCTSNIFTVTYYLDAFTKQPQGGSYIAGNKFHLTWELKFRPEAIILRYCTPEGHPITQVPQFTMDPDKSYYDMEIESGNDSQYYHIWAWLDDDLTVVSDPFRIERKESLVFLTQPTDILIPANGSAELTWKLGFTSYNTEVRIVDMGDPSGTEQIHTLDYPSLTSYTVDYDSSAGERAAVIRTYYDYYDRTKYLDSRVARISQGTIERRFIRQPQELSIPEGGTKQLSWQTNFLPVKSEIWYSYLNNGDYTEPVLAGIIRNTTDFTYPITNDAPGGHYKYAIRSYYTNTEYIESNTADVYMEMKDKGFIIQPENAVCLHNQSATIVWKTNFIPINAVLQHVDDAGEPILNSETLPFFYSKTLNGKNGTIKVLLNGVASCRFRIYIQPETTGGYSVVSDPFTVTEEAGYRLVFNANGGTGEMETRYADSSNRVTLPTCGFEWENHHFVKWQIGSSYYMPGDTVTISDRTTAYAVWSEYVTVSFNANGGSGSMVPIDVVVNEKLTLPECGFSWSNHEFDKWRIGEFTYEPGDEVYITESCTVYATWISYYTITFNANGGTGTMESVTLAEGTQYTLPENAFTSDTHNFSYWALSCYPNARFYPGRTVTVNSNITVRPVWVLKEWCTLTFDMQGRGAQVQPITVEKGTVAAEPTKPTSDLRFAYWEYNENSIAGLEHWVPFDFSQPVTESRTLRAHWVADAMREIRLSYYKEAGTVTLTATGMDGFMVPVGETVHIDITTNPHWSVDWIFVGTLQTHSRAFDMPNQEIVPVRVTFTLDHEHTADTLQVYTPYVAPTCEQEGRGVCYYCPTCDHYYNGSFAWLKDEAAMETLTIPALGHDYGEATYEWDDDYSGITATCVCLNDSSHILTETAEVTATVSREPGVYTRGEHTYIALFENPVFSSQILVVDDIEPLGIPVTEEYFPDSLFRSVVAQKDTDGNGYLSQAEREAVATLNGANKRIVTYEGIQYFPNLTELAAQNNPVLEELDVSMNPKLQKVTLAGSTLLTALDFSANPEMNYIQATNCGGVLTIDVTNCPKLTYLGITGASVTELDLSNNAQLGKLYVIRCAELTELDLSQNTALAQLYTYASGIHALNVNDNPKLITALGGTLSTTTQYDQYRSDNNILQVNQDTVFFSDGGLLVDARSFPDEVFRTYVLDEFDTDGSGWLSPEEIAGATQVYFEGTSLASLQGIEYLSALEYLTVGDAPNFTSVDLSANTALKEIDIYNTGLTALDVSGLPLRFLNCSRSPLQSLTLGAQPKLWSLSIYGPNVTIPTLDLRSYPYLLDAVLSGTKTVTDNYVRYENIEKLEELKVNPGTELIIPGCVRIDAAHFPDEAFRNLIADNFDTNSSGWLTAEEIAAVTSICFEDHEFATVQGIEVFAELEYLCIADADSLKRIDLRANTKLTEIDLCHNDLREINLDGLTAVVYLYVYDNSLEELDVSGLTALQVIQCDDNCLTSLDLSHNTRLTEVECYNNPLNSLNLGSQSSLAALRCYGTDLTELDITGCPRLIAAYHGTKDTSNHDYDRYTAAGCALYVDKGMTIDAGDPEPTFFLPAFLTAIEDEAFAGISAEAVVIPNTVTSIAGNPFTGSSVRYIYGYAGSAAQAFANAYPDQFTFVTIDDAWMARH